MTWTLLVATAARSYRRRQRRMVLLQPQGQLGGDKRLPPLDGGVHRRPVVVAAVGEALRPVVEVEVEREEAPAGVEVQVLGHPLQQGDGVLMQQLVRGMQEAAVGELAAQLETPAGAARIHKRKVAGTCDVYVLRVYSTLGAVPRSPS